MAFSTAISFEDDGNNQGSSKDQIVENIRLHKEVLQSVKYQTWSMRRKLRLVRQAKSYVARHEGALQERYAQSMNTGAMWARFKLLLAAVSGSRLNSPSLTPRILTTFLLNLQSPPSPRADLLT